MFFTLEDPHIQVAGSRDPLGAQALWQHVGGRLVANLTTVTDSVRNFTVFLLGRYAGERLVLEERAGEDEALPIFMRVESAMQFVRFALHEVGGDIRGIDRIRTRSAAGSPVTISDDPAHRILGAQKSGGLWGLYKRPARTSGLIAEEAVGLMPEARAFLAGNLTAVLGSHLDGFLRLASRGGTLQLRRPRRFEMALGRAVQPELGQVEREFYGKALRDAAHAPEAARGRQARLARLMVDHLDDGSLLPDGRIGRDAVLRLRNAAEGDARLAMRLQQVADLEAVLAPSMTLFNFLLHRGRATPEEVGKTVLDRWGRRVLNIDVDALQGMRSEIRKGTGDETITTALLECAEALADGAYARAVRALARWNEALMALREGGPWLAVVGGRLDVRYHSGIEWLPPGDDLPALWRNSYFLDALHRVTLQIDRGVA